MIDAKELRKFYDYLGTMRGIELHPILTFDEIYSKFLTATIDIEQIENKQESTPCPHWIDCKVKNEFCDNETYKQINCFVK